MNEFIENLQKVVSRRNVITHPDKTEHFRTAYRSGVGEASCVVKPNSLIEFCLAAGKEVGVIAVDPTSPFTGGALLGDRVRMNKYAGDKRVFLRSLGNHCALGGLSSKVQEIGDVLFSVVNLARHLKLDSEDLLRRANSKFINRFKAIEKELVEKGKTIDEAKLDEMEEMWDQIKSQGK